MRDMKHYLKSSSTGNFFLLAGPCVIEGEQMAIDIAGEIKTVAEKLNIPYVFKGSYRKANRSRLDSFTGIGDIEALEILGKVGKTYDIPTVTDIHQPEEATLAAPFVDILQIPAFLCRQTDLLLAAAQTGKMVNIKKGQFLAPGAMKHAVAKVRDAGNHNVAVTERGTTFGYQDLIVDIEETVKTYNTIGCKYIAIPYLPNELRYGTEKYPEKIPGRIILRGSILWKLVNGSQLQFLKSNDTIAM